MYYEYWVLSTVSRADVVSADGVSADGVIQGRESRGRGSKSVNRFCCERCDCCWFVNCGSLDVLPSWKEDVSSFIGRL